MVLDFMLRSFWKGFQRFLQAKIAQKFIFNMFIRAKLKILGQCNLGEKTQTIFIPFFEFFNSFSSTITPGKWVLCIVVVCFIFCSKYVASYDIFSKIAANVKIYGNKIPNLSLLMSHFHKYCFWDNCEECINRGGFGSPTFFLGHYMYFGNDRIPLLLRRLEILSNNSGGSDVRIWFAKSKLWGMWNIKRQIT